jgi:hypothetical protein
MKSSRIKRLYFIIICFFIVLIAGALPGILAAPDFRIDARHSSPAELRIQQAMSSIGRAY